MYRIKNKILEFGEKIDKLWDPEWAKKHQIEVSLFWLLLMIAMNIRIFVKNDLAENFSLLVVITFFIFLAIYLTAKFMKNKSIGLLLVVLGFVFIIVMGIIMLMYNIAGILIFQTVEDMENTGDIVLEVFAILMIAGGILYAMEYILKNTLFKKEKG